jgi:hypothetical protein
LASLNPIKKPGAAPARTQIASFNFLNPLICPRASSFICKADSIVLKVTESDEAILARLVVLNKGRAEEEKRGHVCWLRPE